MRKGQRERGRENKKKNLVGEYEAESASILSRPLGDGGGFFSRRWTVDCLSSPVSLLRCRFVEPSCVPGDSAFLFLPQSRVLMPSDQCVVSLSLSSPTVGLSSPTNNFLTCICSPFDLHAHLPPPSPSSAPLPSPASGGPLGPFRGNCGLGCFISRAVRVG